MKFFDFVVVIDRHIAEQLPERFEFAVVKGGTIVHICDESVLGQCSVSSSVVSFASSSSSFPLSRIRCTLRCSLQHLQVAAGVFAFSISIPTDGGFGSKPLKQLTVATMVVDRFR